MTTTEAQLSHGRADVGGGIHLHYVEAGTGPLVILLHGFPEFWYSWRHQIGPLAEAGYHVVAPDMRGYDLSDKPQGWRAYDTGLLADDIAGLINSFGAPTGAPHTGGHPEGHTQGGASTPAGEQQAYVVGHDWGAAVAYAVAMGHPEVVRRLAILNVPHPQRMLEGFKTLKQLRKSWYMFFFQIPRLPELLIAREDFSFAKRSLRSDSKAAFTDEDLERYVEAWSQPGALTAMINYYRAALRRSPRKTLAQMKPIEASTLVIWGMRDRHLGSELAVPAPEWVPNVRFEPIAEATHWVQHDAPQRVNELLLGFFDEAHS
ncbi:MAG TPA: alpha/beta hydrolase [Solirubrobacteraceae bacterium]|nr:alpha/beta hydrolase [Solirubrobacteraceae bacterium]